LPLIWGELGSFGKVSFGKVSFSMTAFSGPKAKLAGNTYFRWEFSANYGAGGGAATPNAWKEGRKKGSGVGTGGGPQKQKRGRTADGEARVRNDIADDSDRFRQRGLRDVERTVSRFCDTQILRRQILRTLRLGPELFAD
jgi:hypothetical protein